MADALDVPELVGRRALSNGVAGRAWLDALPDVVATLAGRWGLQMGSPLRGGTAAFVARAHDLGIPMREYNQSLLAGDTQRLVRERAETLASLCGLDPEPVWQWGFIERVSTGLANIRDFGGDNGAEFLEVAARCLTRTRHRS
jgi:hypothetical protein